jgi:hypothetical protein
MTFTEIFPAPQTKAGGLFWLPCYVRLAQEVYSGYVRAGEDYEREHHVRSCAMRWGITRRCSLALLTGEATYDLNDDTVTVTRTIVEE